MTTLFLVESGHKAETIKHMLGKDYIVLPTVGHVMDLDPHKMSIDIEHNFEPEYIINEDKKKVVQEIKAAAKKVNKILFASDPDREGEMITWSVAHILGVKDPLRVTYTEITKDAILKAIQNPRKMDNNLLDAQKARRILDRLVGYEISPILGKILSIKMLSAGRVQSVVTRLIVDKEREIEAFFKNEQSATFKFSGEFTCGKDLMSSKLFNKKSSEIEPVENEKHVEEEDIVETEDEKGIVKMNSKDSAKELMEKLGSSKFKISAVKERMTNRYPSPPFSTSSMQQASANKLGYTVQRTMSAAQKLYEAGHITYLRTDSVNLSDEALKNIGDYVKDKYGDKYHNRTQFKSKGKNTQEAHEAIRPTNVNVTGNLTGKNIKDEEQRLYTLIWKRAVASQMAPAKVKVIKIYIDIDKLKKYEFIANTENIEFPGFLKVYNISGGENEETKIIKNIPNVGDKCEIEKITGKQTYQKPPSRYNDGSLVNKMKPENLNIGRPATTQSIITKIQDRDYVVKGDVEGVEKDILIYTINKKNKLSEEKEKIFLGKETNKFIPTELGLKVTDLLVKYFPEVMEYKFTSDMEDKLDEIAEGKIKWVGMMKDFYKAFHPIVEKIKKEMKDIVKSNTKVIGQFPETKEDIIATMAQFGPVIKMKKVIDGKKKYVYAPIKKPLTIDTITFDDAIKLFEYPKNLGKHEGTDVIFQRGKYGYYLIYGDEKISTGENKDVKLEDAIKYINEKNAKSLWMGKDGTKTYKVLEGEYGKYINITETVKGKKKRRNVKLPKDTDVKDLTMEKVKEIETTWKPKRKFIPKKK